MRVLVACEFSGRVRDAFIARGHNAISCDLIPTEAPGPHITGDVMDLLPGDWDIMVAFPPCTYLAASGARWHYGTERFMEALQFVLALSKSGVPRIAIENPVGAISTWLRKPDQIIQPWQFGHGEVKTTCLWLTNLPKLQPTDTVDGRYQRAWRMPERKSRAHDRSITYQGIAEAMASQWG